jgi:Rrf2 family nitric oxide-sensitive transcriptional repressor
LTGNCQLTGIISGALQSFMQYLDRYTLADLLAPAAESTVKIWPVTFGKRPSVSAS